MTRRQPPGTAVAAPPGPGAPLPPPAAPVLITDRCAGCGACLLTCPERAVRPRGGTLLVRADLCTGCGECVEVCPVDAIEESPAVPAGPPGLPGPRVPNPAEGGDR